MIEESLHAIQQRMADAMARVGRVDTALLVAVTKNHPVSAVEEAASLGVTHVRGKPSTRGQGKTAHLQGATINMALDWSFTGQQGASSGAYV